MATLAFVYLIVLIAYVNLKPAIPLLNPHAYDMVLEYWERSLFGGVLPTEYFISNSSFFAVAFWNIIYGLFTPFMFVSVAIALQHDGLSGGSLLTLAYTIGLFISLLFTLLFPTFGPIFTHSGWFEAFSSLPSNQLAVFLNRTVREYAQRPGTVYACAGISAMPSYHIFACICGLMYWRYLPTAFQVLGVGIVLLVWISTFILGWHYVLDGVAGIVLGVIVMRALKLIKQHSVNKCNIGS